MKAKIFEIYIKNLFRCKIIDNEYLMPHKLCNFEKVKECKEISTSWPEIISK